MSAGQRCKGSSLYVGQVKVPLTSYDVYVDVNGERRRVVLTAGAANEPGTVHVRALPDGEHAGTVVAKDGSGSFTAPFDPRKAFGANGRKAAPVFPAEGVVAETAMLAADGLNQKQLRAVLNSLRAKNAVAAFLPAVADHVTMVWYKSHGKRQTAPARHARSAAGRANAVPDPRCPAYLELGDAMARAHLNGTLTAEHVGALVRKYPFVAARPSDGGELAAIVSMHNLNLAAQLARPLQRGVPGVVGSGER